MAYPGGNATGTTVILATHDRSIVDALNVRVLRLEGGKLVRDSVGPYDAPNVIQAPIAAAPIPPPPMMPDPQAAPPIAEQPIEQAEPAPQTEAAPEVPVHKKHASHSHATPHKHPTHPHPSAHHEAHGKHGTKVKPISIDSNN